MSDSLKNQAATSLKNCKEIIENLPEEFAKWPEIQALRAKIHDLEEALTSHKDPSVLEQHLQEIDPLICELGQGLAEHMKNLLPKVE